MLQEQSLGRKCTPPKIPQRQEMLSTKPKPGPCVAASAGDQGSGLGVSVWGVVFGVLSLGVEGVGSRVKGLGFRA